MYHPCNQRDYQAITQSNLHNEVTHNFLFILINYRNMVIGMFGVVDSSLQQYLSPEPSHCAGV